MAKKYTEMQGIAAIDEGRLARTLDERINAVQKDFLKHVKKYGRAACEKAKAEITLKVSIRCAGTDGAYVLAGAIETKLPGPPTRGTLAIESENDDHELALFTQPAGSSEDDPRQAKLATHDGRAVVGDEVKPPVAPAPGGTRPADGAK